MNKKAIKFGHWYTFSKIIIISFLILLSGSCQRISNQVPDHIQEALENVKSEHVSDSRLQLFDVHLQKRGDQLILTGEVTEPNLKAILIDSIRSVASYHDLVDSIRVLPEENIKPNVYGIVYVSVANMREEPRYSAQLVSQTTMGTVLELYKKKRNFYYVRNWDRYLGWLNGASMVEVDSSTAVQWKEGPRVVCISNYGLVYNQPNETSEVLTDLVPGAKLKQIESLGNWVKIETPDARVGYVKTKLVMSESAFENIQPTRNRIVNTAKAFLGIPYLWGGTSAKGFDCSGLVQMIFLMNGISLPRDANMIVLHGIPIEPDENFGNLLPGDLLFFGSKPGRITHVALYIGNQQYIHSDAWVHKNSFDPQHPLYNEYRHNTFQTVRRIQIK